MSVSPLSNTKFKLIFSFIWLFIMGVHTLLMYWQGFSFRIALVDAAVGTTHLMLASLLLINTLKYYSPKKERFFYLAAWCILLTVAIILFSRWALVAFLRKEETFLAFFSETLIIRISFYFLLTGIATLLSVIWYSRIEEEESNQRKLDMEKQAREAELFKLRQQLQPHFLFNSLNSINALIGSQPAEARKMVLQLSDFLRGTIRKEANQWVTLHEELQHLQLYLDIEKVRFGHRLDAVIDLDDKAAQLKMPALLLQPIVENAIKFGLYDTTGKILIRLQAITDNNDLVIKTSNPFDPQTATSQQGTGFGLQSVQRRLYLLFARNDLLQTETKENIFTITIRIPQA
jgi:two-component system, LytTR family, sensor kinase